MQGKTAIVTGAGQGIGKGIAMRLLELGMNVVIAEIDPWAGREAAQELDRLGPVRFIECDVTDEAAVERMVAQTVAEFGRLDALINNAGIAHPYADPVDRLELAYWHKVLDANLTAPLICVKYAAPHLRAQGGAIVNISSTRAMMSEADTEPYSAAKGGLVALTRALAVSLGPEVRANCISPGWIETHPWLRSDMRRTRELRPIDTGQHPVGRVGTPLDVGALVAFLISDDSGFITGQNFALDGGMTIKMIYAD